KPFTLLGTTARHENFTKLLTGTLTGSDSPSRYARLRTAFPFSSRHCSTRFFGVSQVMALSVSLSRTALTVIVSPATACDCSRRYVMPAVAFPPKVRSARATAAWARFFLDLIRE